MGERTNVCRILVGKRERWRLLKRLRHLSYDAFKTDFELAQWNKINVAWDKIHLGTYLSIVMKVYFPKVSGNS
jgi:hypothetical protein